MNASAIVNNLLESGQGDFGFDDEESSGFLDDHPALDWLDWPEFSSWSRYDMQDYLDLDCVPMFIEKYNGWFDLDFNRNFLLSTEPGQHSYRLDRDEFQQVTARAREDEQARWRSKWDAQDRAPWPEYEPEPPEYTLDQKRAHIVYETADYLFFKLPNDPAFVQREGKSMSHCLNGCHHSYVSRMQGGEIEVYSMTDKRDNKPRVNIEVALTKGSYSSRKVEKPAVTQIRGIRNECPPKDEYLPALMDFFQNYGANWQLSSHDVNNFDGRIDGDRVLSRWQELQSGI